MKKGFSFSATLFVVSILLYVAIVVIFYLVIGFDRASIEHRITETTSDLDHSLFILSYLRTPLDDGTLLDSLILGETAAVRQQTERILHSLFDAKVCWTLEFGPEKIKSDCFNPVFVKLLDASVAVPSHYEGNLRSKVHLMVTGYEGEPVE